MSISLLFLSLIKKLSGQGVFIGVGTGFGGFLVQGCLLCDTFNILFLFQVRFMSARAAVAFITDQVEEVKQRQFVDLVPGIVQVKL